MDLSTINKDGFISYISLTTTTTTKPLPSTLLKNTLLLLSPPGTTKKDLSQFNSMRATPSKTSQIKQSNCLKLQKKYYFHVIQINGFLRKRYIKLFSSQLS